MAISSAAAEHNDINAGHPIIWDQASLSSALSLKVPYTFEAYGISIDSRTTKPGDIFIALKGPNFNGNDFVSEALRKGAVLAIIDEEAKASSGTVLVPSCYEALLSLAKFARSRLDGKLIGITGSVGKTSTKEMLKIALRFQGEVYATRGSYNNHIGVPLSLAELSEETRYAVIEVGMNHAGEIAKLTQLMIPDIAIITNVEAAHLGNFSSLSAIADAKSEIFDSMLPGGFAILNFDNEYCNILLKKAKSKELGIIGFSETKSTPAKLLSYEVRDGLSHIKAEVFGKEYEYSIGTIGKHFALQSTAVLAAVKIAGAEVDYAARNLKDFGNVKGRGNVIHANGYIVIDESYNASPPAVKAALGNVIHHKGDKKGRAIAILGDMAELGRYASAMHTELAEHVVKSGVDIVFTVGEHMENLYNALPSKMRGLHTHTSEEMSKCIMSYLQPGDVILVKGRHTMCMDKVVKALVTA